MKLSKEARRKNALARFKTLPFYDWANQNFGGVGSVPDNHEQLYADYVARKNAELKALGG